MSAHTLSTGIIDKNTMEISGAYPKQLTLVVRNSDKPGSTPDEIRHFVLCKPLEVVTTGNAVKVEISALPPNDPEATCWDNDVVSLTGSCVGCKHPASRHYAFEGPCLVRGCRCTAFEEDFSTASIGIEDGNQD